MRILERNVFVGPSGMHAHFPVIKLELDLGEMEKWPTANLVMNLSTGWLLPCRG